MYPFYTMSSFPSGFNLVWVMEGLFAIDICLNFFKQELDESGNSKFESLETVSSKYLTGQFPLDFVAFLPIGLIVSMIDERLRFLWVIKAIRVG
mmetsp:Transcript_33523/g.51522  ORF Transcript_33523/g.51522 Transcript_33523/m.51522 type:complete len:94 (+) Transcript_33523:125-406(+)